MPSGIRVWDPSGNLVSDPTYNLLRITNAFIFSGTGEWGGVNGNYDSTTDARLNNKTPWVYFRQWFHTSEDRSVTKSNANTITLTPSLNKIEYSLHPADPTQPSTSLVMYGTKD